MSDDPPKRKIGVVALAVMATSSGPPVGTRIRTAHGVRNLLFAGAVIATTALLRQRIIRTTSQGDDMGPAPGRRNTPESSRQPEDIVSALMVGGNQQNEHDQLSSRTDALLTEVRELTALADHLFGLRELAAQCDVFEYRDDEFSDHTFVRLDDLRWMLANYVIKGGRVRRLAQLPRLLGSGACSGEYDGDLTQSPLAQLRRTGNELLERIRETNAMTAEWLLSNRVAIPDPDFLDTNVLLNRYDRLQLEPAAVSGDPLYLLTCHIHDVLEVTGETETETDHPTLGCLEAQLLKPLGTIDREITAALAFSTALLALVRLPRETEAA